MISYVVCDLSREETNSELRKLIWKKLIRKGKSMTACQIVWCFDAYSPDDIMEELEKLVKDNKVGRLENSQGDFEYFVNLRLVK